MGLRRRPAAAVLVFAALTAASADEAYRASIAAWRAQREAGLKAEDGWLSVAGLFWLKEGPNRFGTDKTNPIVLPADSAPPVVGWFDLRAGKVTARIEPGVTVTAADKPVTVMELRPDTTGTPDVLKVGRLSLHVIERGGRLAVRMKDPDCEARRRFAGLRWFPVREDYRVTAHFISRPTPVKIAVANVLGQVDEMPSPGTAVFTLGGKELRLEPVLEGPDAKELFFIFRDATAGHETYPAGRFLYTPLPAGDTVEIDFNKAYSPPCAFTAFATCPLPPTQNRLAVRIEAGELYSGPHR